MVEFCWQSVKELAVGNLSPRASWVSVRPDICLLAIDDTIETDGSHLGHGAAVDEWEQGMSKVLRALSIAYRCFPLIAEQFEEDDDLEAGFDESHSATREYEKAQTATSASVA